MQLGKNAACQFAHFQTNPTSKGLKFLERSTVQVRWRIASGSFGFVKTTKRGILAKRYVQLAAAVGCLTKC